MVGKYIFKKRGKMWSLRDTYLSPKFFFTIDYYIFYYSTDRNVSAVYVTFNRTRRTVKGEND